MEFSRRQIKDAIEWDGSSSIDDDGSDYCYEVLEQADPEIVATIRKELADDNWGLALLLNQPSSEPIKKSPDIRNPYDRFSWMNQF